MGNSGTATNGYANSNQFTCSGTNPSWNICNLTSSQFTTNKSLNLNYPATADVLINVTGSAISLANGQVTYDNQPLANSPAAKRIIINFAQAGSLSISGYGIGGTILAPRASLTHTNGTIDGSVIINSLSATGSFTCNGSYRGNLPAGL